MDLGILKKKISTFRSEKGLLRNVSDELLIEILAAWENWSGPASGFYSGIGVDHRKMASLMGRAKRLKREGFGVSDFKEIKLEAESGQIVELGPCSGVEVVWRGGQVLRFSGVDILIDFLKKAS